PAAPQARPGEAPSPRLKGMRVLVADNDERVRKSAHGILGRWGCIVETARDGQEALTMARIRTYHAILPAIPLPPITPSHAWHTPGPASSRCPPTAPTPRTPSSTPARTG